MAESEFSSVYGDSRFLSFVNSKLLLELTSFSFALTNTTRDLCFLLFCPNFQAIIRIKVLVLIYFFLECSTNISDGGGHLC